MLVLRREVGQRIIIGDRTISVMVTATGEGWAKIGIEAPPEVPVHREEIYEAIHGGKEQP
ncbi:MAG: carbon storage regulator [Phycisphaerae bacterium]